MISFICAPEGKFIVVGHVKINKALLHLGKDNLEDAIGFAKDILSGEIKFESMIAEKPEDFSGIDIIDDKCRTLWSHGGPYGSSFLLN